MFEDSALADRLAYYRAIVDRFAPGPATTAGPAIIVTGSGATDLLHPFDEILCIDEFADEVGDAVYVVADISTRLRFHVFLDSYETWLSFRLERAERRHAECMAALRRLFDRPVERLSTHANDLLEDHQLSDSIESSYCGTDALRWLMRLIDLWEVAQMRVQPGTPRYPDHSVYRPARDVRVPSAPTAVSPRRRTVDPRQSLTCRTSGSRRGRLLLRNTSSGLG